MSIVLPKCSGFSFSYLLYDARSHAHISRTSAFSRNDSLRHPDPISADAFTFILGNPNISKINNDVSSIFESCRVKLQDRPLRRNSTWQVSQPTPVFSQDIISDSLKRKTTPYDSTSVKHAWKARKRARYRRAFPSGSSEDVEMGNCTTVSSQCPEAWIRKFLFDIDSDSTTVDIRVGLLELLMRWCTVDSHTEYRTVVLRNDILGPLFHILNVDSLDFFSPFMVQATKFPRQRNPTIYSLLDIQLPSSSTSSRFFFNALTNAFRFQDSSNMLEHQLLRELNIQQPSGIASFVEFCSFSKLETSEPSTSTSLFSLKPPTSFTLAEALWFTVPQIEFKKNLALCLEMESTLRSRLADSESLLYDTNYAEEYAEEIYEYMARLSEEFKPDPHYIRHQKSLKWRDRRELIDWMIDIDWRIDTNKQPETIWLAVNLVDRFLSVNWNISEDKLDLVGLSTLLVASKFQELIPPSVCLLANMANWEFTPSQIKRAERKLLDKLDFRISPYSSPHSWMTRIWKATTVKDEREVALSMFLIEFSLLDYRFLPMTPAKIAAVGIYIARMMLDYFWDQSFVEHSGFTSEDLSLGYRMLIERLRDSDTPCLDVYAKYANKTHLEVSRFAYDWGNSQSAREINVAERIEYVEEAASSDGREEAGGDPSSESE